MQQKYQQQQQDHQRRRRHRRRSRSTQLPSPIFGPFLSVTSWELLTIMLLVTTTVATAVRNSRIHVSGFSSVLKNNQIIINNNDCNNRIRPQHYQNQHSAFGSRHGSRIHSRTTTTSISRWLLQASVCTTTTSSSNINNSNIRSMKFSSDSSDASPSTSSSGSTINLEPLVVCGPSGVGKGTIIQGLLDSFVPSSPFGFCVSHTTRSPRPGEVHGQHYLFTSVEEMQNDINDGKFIEHAIVHGNYYGTSKDAIRRVQEMNKISILDIDVQGVMSVKESFSSSNTPCKYIFITPPSMDELERRLRGRGTESEDSIKRRLGNAAREIEYGTQVGNFDRILVNNNLDDTVHEMITTLKLWYPQLNQHQADLG